MTCNDFKKAIEAEFGKCEFKATNAEKVIKSAGWKDTPDKKFVKPCMDYLIGKKNGKTSPQHL
jgi:hypothetical protein